MKELKNRIKGLSAILLAMSLLLYLMAGMSEVRVSAEGKIIKVADYGSGATPLLSCVDTIFSEEGDGLERYGSGGNFVLVDCSAEMFASYLTFKEDTEYSYYYEVKVINNEFPSEYEAIKISKVSRATNNDGTPKDAGPYGSLYSLTLEWVPKTTISVGIPMAMTTGTKYSFPIGSSTHEVQGDPTNYYTTDFYVSSSGTYIILR